MTALAEPELAEVDVALGPTGLLELRRWPEEDWPEWATARFPVDAEKVEFVLPEEGAPYTAFDRYRLTIPPRDLFVENPFGPVTMLWSVETGGDTFSLDLTTLVET